MMIINKLAILATCVLVVMGCAGSGADHSDPLPVPFGIVWAENGQGTGGLYKVTSGHEIAALVVHDSSTSIRSYALSTDGRIAYKTQSGSVETIHVANSSGGIEAESDFTVDPGTFGGVAFSADGQSLVTASTQEGQTDLYVMPASGAMTRVKITNDGNIDPNSTIGWNTNGYIYFVEGAQNGLHVWRIIATGQAAPELVSGNEGKMVNLSPDNLTITFVSLDGQLVTKRNLDSGDEEPIGSLGDSGAITGASWIDDQTVNYIHRDPSFIFHIDVVDANTHDLIEYDPGYQMGSIATYGSGGMNNIPQG